ncbi:MAG: hypothetical protein HFF17_07550 [Oscillospiraceae bacterium]|nr:hypothetical protein [Oscillospiraceae bacterium]
MAMTAKVENYLADRHNTTQGINVEIGTRACINCIWYEKHYRENRGNIRLYVPISTGYCLLHEQNRGALRQPCKDYETKESPARRGRQAAAGGRAEV